jgi:hypothetical protein
MASLGRKKSAEPARDKSKPVSAADVRRALRVRFDAPTFAIFDEVGNATGTHCRRHADAVAIGLWPSRGLDIHGIEIKVSRYDWLKELKQPEKADAIAQYCDRWWIAVGADNIVQPGELPTNWGLLVLSGGKLICKSEAPKLEPTGTPRAFLAALLRKAQESSNAVRLAGYADGFAKGCGEGPEQHQRVLHAAESQRDQFKKAIDSFEEASGLKIDGWRAGDIGKAVYDLMALRGYHRTSDAAEELETVAADLERTAARLRDERERIIKARTLAAKLPEVSNG